MKDDVGDVIDADVAGVDAEQNSGAAAGTGDDDVGSAERTDKGDDVAVAGATCSCVLLLVT